MQVRRTRKGVSPQGRALFYVVKSQVDWLVSLPLAAGKHDVTVCVNDQRGGLLVQRSVEAI